MIISNYGGHRRVVRAVQCDVSDRLTSACGQWLGLPSTLEVAYDTEPAFVIFERDKFLAKAQYLARQAYTLKRC